MKKKESTIALLALLVIFMTIILLHGITIGVAGKFHFTTKYYNNVSDAFYSEFTPSVTRGGIISINRIIDNFQIDESNFLYFAITDDGKLLVISVLCKNDKYASTGDYCLYEIDNYGNYDKEKGLGGTISYTYGKNGIFSGEFRWCIVFSEGFQYAKSQNVQYKEYKLNDEDTFLFVYW